MMLIASCVWRGATLNAHTDLLERRAFSTVLVSVTANPTAPAPTTSIAIPPVQIAVPISQPMCRAQANLGSVPQNLTITDGQVSPNSLLYRIRQMVCNGTCSVPQGVPPSDVAIVAHNGCEISIGVTNTLEAWIASTFPPVGVEQQECWNSTQSIIEQCVQNQANTGWWNGDHIYQFYQAGFRPLNDPGSIHVSSFSSSITAILTSTIPSKAASSSSTSQPTSHSQTVASLLYPVQTSSDGTSTGTTSTAITSATIISSSPPESKSHSGARSLSGGSSFTVAVFCILNLMVVDLVVF